MESEARESAVEAATDPVQAGMQIYDARCQQCHQPSGLGVPGVFPPLIGAEWVTGPPEVPVLILLNGLRGPIRVGGEP
ncbi:MAG: cytochrome c, partial [Gammaproteobacteria bacterium]|nr:cytochrome c [Gemmatimonadota bacterium]NIR42248.1 cytochrome c [Actinomycetota bacterium]NIU80489.1 cytochrome c [Gammaproteobacteria bacterium]